MVRLDSQAVDLGFIDINPTEYMAYLYMPIKLIDSHQVEYEARLDVFDPIIQRSYTDFVNTFGGDEFFGRYMYITAKRLFVTPDNIGNRPGWHCDGFGTDDINYIWTDKFPTIFNHGLFSVDNDDRLALQQMKERVDSASNYNFGVGHLARIDSKVLHRTPTIYESGMRTFVKISFSRHRFNLEGNTRNYRLSYDWSMYPRENERNIENKAER